MFLFSTHLFKEVSEVTVRQVTALTPTCSAVLSYMNMSAVIEVTSQALLAVMHDGWRAVTKGAISITTEWRSRAAK